MSSNDNTKQQTHGPSYRDELALTRHFVAVLEQRLAGRDSDRRVNMHPLDWCHLGVLGPAKVTPASLELEEEQAELDDSKSDASTLKKGAVSTTAGAAVTPERPSVKTKSEDAPEETAASPSDRVDVKEGARRPPSALGFEILVQPDDDGVVELTVDVEFVIFTKHLPSLEEQMSVIGAGPAEGLPLAEVVQRWLVAAKGIRFQVHRNGRESFTDDNASQAAIDATLELAFGRSDAARKWPGNRPKVDNPAVFKDAASFDGFLRRLTAGTEVERWGLRGGVELHVWPRADGKLRIGCYIRNRTLRSGVGYEDAFKVIGDARLAAHIVRGDLHPIEILPVPQDYQYDRHVWGVGHNTSVRVAHDKKSLETAALAEYEQLRLTTKDKPTAKFHELDAKPFDTLDVIYEAMGEYANDWESKVLGKNELGLDEASLAECREDLEGFRKERNRFAAGVAALKADGKLLDAFRAMNRVFGRTAKGYDSWRLFQLVFIVTQLPALTIREGITEGSYPAGTPRDWSDILRWGDVLWFRTGGGKTEAYLGLTCSAMLYDRLRGKNFGITSWLRFPLRMLSVQQLQRAMKVVWEAEQERKALLGASASESDPFRLGYFVGGTTTPNSLSEEEFNKYRSDEDLETLRVVPDCPACQGRGTVKVKKDLSAMRFRHVCTQCEAELPLDISDDEVYRNLPALIVGTVDKMASVGQQIKFGVLWGGAKWRCPQHGYSFGEYCFSFGCKVAKKSRIPVEPYDPSPAFHIQDELHLLEEELGAFSGHYETLIRYCEVSRSDCPSKVVAATATIEGFEHQVQHLYGVKGARRFPGRGYDRYATFYAEQELDTDDTPKTARFFVAFKSESLHAADASAFCTEILQTEICRLIQNPHDALALLKDAVSEEDVWELLKYYTTTLNYVKSLQWGSRVNQALQNAATKTRLNAGREMTVEYHSSRSSGAEVADLVHRVENPPKWTSAEFLDALVATNMISHGVDLERVNLMTMDGVPEETADYIQASSRSGRKHVGLIVVVLTSYSLRATSIYHRFLEYHDHLDRMVSPVPVNRFAKYAAHRTLPGITVGLVHGRHAVLAGKQNLKYRHEAAALLNGLGPDVFFDEIKNAYALGEGVYDEALEKGLAEALGKDFDVIRLSINNGLAASLRDAVRPVPMRSLRDVEAGVPFQPDVDYRVLQWLQKAKEQ